MACIEHTGETLFCSTCGKVRDRAGLRSVKLQSFTGPASLNPNVERFWETGDPELAFGKKHG